MAAQKEGVRSPSHTRYYYYYIIIIITRTLAVAGRGTGAKRTMMSHEPWGGSMPIAGSIVSERDATSTAGASASCTSGCASSV